MEPEPVTTDPRPLSGDACARCGAAFECGMKTGIERCWCADLPAIAPDSTLTGCLCPRCLKEFSAQQTAAR